MNRNLITVVLLAASLAILALSSIKADVPNGFPSNTDLDRISVDDYYTVVATSSAATKTFTTQGKTISVTNEGSGNARISFDGRVASSTNGQLITAGANFYDSKFCTKSLGYIRTGSVDTTLTIRVTY